MSMSSDPILKAEDITVRYGDFTAVQDVTFSIPERGIVSVIGSNGAGKSTLLDCIAGSHKPSHGRIIFKGEDITGLPPNVIVERGLSLVPQGGRCFARMTVEENLIMGAYVKRARAGMRQRLALVYELFPMLREKRRIPAGSLSGGQRQMAAIGRALMSEPELILFDEISLGLAPAVIKDIYARIRRINSQGVSVLLVEQDVRRSIKSSDYCHILLKGSILLSGESDKLTQDEIKSAYFGL